MLYTKEIMNEQEHSSLMLREDRMDRIETERLLIRKAREDDLMPIWQNIWKDADTAKSMLWQPTLTYEDAKSRMERTIRFQSENNAWFVCLKETDEPVGFCGVKETEPGMFDEMGLCIAAKYRGQGLGREMLRALIDLVFNELGGVRFEYGCFRENTASAALCKSCGFTYCRSGEFTREWDGYRYTCDFYELKKDAVKTL
ncbi:MAG: GNAT family N-acetyltransferase [Clostridiales bacterium]|nr:GNAT family N-acetyltransferase [Clostridiales bacterium]